ncbi:hypothetical protein LCGC14_1335870 [marine sediment metagenome]|uniref:Transposase IS891/IS1136/IS1341 domain-containing protein n=1 Tax=marine sediment metagenome TaxID=412755 RepID=A0A0F9L199_9ZZZZ
MLLTEQIQLKSSKKLSELCHKAKNLYNLANWYFRQDFFNLSNILFYNDLYFILRHKHAYMELPSGSAQQIIKLVSREWKSYFKASRDYKKNPKKYKRKPNIPRYKRKDGEYILIFTNQQCKIKNGYLYFPHVFFKIDLKPIKTRIKDNIKEVRIIPKGINYNLEIIYEKEEQDFGLEKDHILSIDLGLNNLITAVNNNSCKPFIIKGGMIKSINQYYNKQLAYYRSVAKKVNDKYETKRIQRLHLKRNNKINTLFHRISKNVIDYCILNDIGTIVIGYNKGWKQNINIGKRNNQNFVQVPFYKLVHQIKYKSELVGIQFVSINESYTSKCSFLDNEEIKKHNKYLGKRICRGLFKSSDGTIINADVNGAYNIMKKAFPNSVEVDEIEAFGLMPQIIYQNIIDTTIRN